MNIKIEHVQAAVPVAILTTHGDIDASNFMELVQKAQEVYRSGIHYLLLDLSDTPFLSSSGLVALHSITLLMRGEQPLDPETGWTAIHAIEEEIDRGMQERVKLLNPQPRVDRTLERTGLKRFFPIFTDRDEALASFRSENAPASAA